MTPEAIKRITINGVELGYSLHEAESNQPPLVFVHGYAMRSTAGPYEELLKLLAPHFAVHALDLRGHSASAALASWSHGELADDVVAFSQILNLNRPVFVAHSFGAFIGLLAGIRHPGAFSALCLLSPDPADPRRDPVDTVAFLIEHGHDRDTLREGFARMFVRLAGRTLDIVLDAVTLIDKRVHLAQREQNSQISISDRLQDVAAPALLVCGKLDSVVPLASHHDIASKLQSCKEVVFSSEGHMLPNEQAAIAAREILVFLDRDRVPKTVASN